MPRSLLGTYLRFLRSPSLTDEPEQVSGGEALKATLRLYTLHLLMVIVLGGFITQISGIEDSHQLTQIIENMSPIELFATVAIIGPLLEECIFRLPLRPFAVNIALALSLVVLLGLQLFLPAPSTLLVIGTALVALNLYLWARRSRSTVLNSLYTKYPRIIFYVIVLSFSILHITNFDPAVWALVPLLVLPQLVIALWLGFVRLRYGFGWAFFAHAFHNGALVLPVLFTKLLSSSTILNVDEVDLRSLSLPDTILLAGIGLYNIGGLVLAAVVAWVLINEWKRAQ
ncbi:MAG: hypothetical protein AAGM45_05835 [Cyanobacteria bacterium J06588_5]